MVLFQPAQFRLLQFEEWIDGEECERKLDLLRKLTARRTDGTIAALSETRIEQSFNERLFAELFGYRTLFRTGAARYELSPKGRNEVTGRFDDFRLGFFGPDGGVPVVTGEYKSPQTDLDAPQGGSYGGVSPVEQAHRAAHGLQDIKWVIVSNFDEIRLYRAGEMGAFEHAFLSEIVSYDDVRRLCTLFSKATLLGKRRGLSPLLLLATEGLPMILPALDRHVRLVHEARSTGLLQPAPLYLVDEALKEAGHVAATEPKWQSWPRLRDPVVPEMGPKADRLVVEQATDRGLTTRLELTTNGVLRLQEYFPPEGGGVVDGRAECHIEVEDLARRMFIFRQVARIALRSIGVTNAHCRWTMHEAKRAVFVASPEWTGAASMLFLLADQDLCQSQDQVNAEDITASTAAVARVGPAIRELLFPFHSRDRGAKGPIVRVGKIDYALACVSQEVTI